MTKTYSNYACDRMRAEASAVIAATKLVPVDAIKLVSPKRTIPADLAFPVFAAAKSTNTKPEELAQRLAEAITLPADSLFATAKAVGGYVNFSVRPEAFAVAVLNGFAERGDAYGEDLSLGEGKTVVVEFSSPDMSGQPDTEMLRSTIMGHSISRVLAALGYNVVRTSQPGDWGTPCGTILAALDTTKQEPWNEPDPLQALEDIHARFAPPSGWKNAEDEPMARPSIWLKKLEEGDAWARETWQHIIDIYQPEFSAIYKRLGVAFDFEQGESYFAAMQDAVIQEALDKGVAHWVEGSAVIVDFGDSKGSLPSCLLRKTDGTSLCLTRTVAAILHRWREHRFHRNIYIVNAEQVLHFQQAFEIARRMGYEKITDRSICLPVASVIEVEYIHDDNGRFRTQPVSGQYPVLVKDVLDSAIASEERTIRTAMEWLGKSLSESDILSKAKIRGLCRVFYPNLNKVAEQSPKIFRDDDSVSFTYSSSFFVQNVHVRCSRILQRARHTPEFLRRARHTPKLEYAHLLIAPKEQSVLKHLARLPLVVRQAGGNYYPLAILDWTYELAREFMRFYEYCLKHVSDSKPRIPATNEEHAAARLQLVVAIAQGLKNGLSLLGIQAAEYI